MSFFDKAITFFSKIIESIIKLPSAIWEFLKLIPEMIWDLIKGAINLIVEGIDFIVNFIKDFFSNLLEFLKYIFVPSENYFINNFNNLKSLVSGKLNIDLSIIEKLGTAQEINPLQNINFTIMGSSVSMNISSLSKVRDITLALSSGLVAIFLCYFHSKKIVWLIRGGSQE